MGMREYILRRAISSIITLALIIALNFFIFRIMPGDPTRTIVGDVRLRPETRELLRQQFGLDKPIWIQFILYIQNLAIGNLGVSFQYRGTPVTEVIFGRRLINTLILMGSSIGLALIMGMVLGVIAAWKRGSKLDVSMLTFTLVAYSMPVFWLGMLIILFFGFYLKLIPLAGTVTPGVEYSNFFDYALDYLHHLIGPMVTLTIIDVAYYFLIMRNTMLDIFTEDYMLTAKAKGLRDRIILFRHGMKNAMLPMVSVIALTVVYLFGGATLTETVFSWYGIGRLTYESVMMADYPVLQGIFLVMAIAVILANFIADIVYAYLDPRIRY